MAYDLNNYDINEDAFALINLMDGVLERVVAIYESYGVPLPARRYWTLGTPAQDCEQIVVSFIQMYLGPPGDEASQPMHCNTLRTAVLSISIIRPIPVVNDNGKAPAAEKIQAAAKISAIDAWVLMESMQLFDQWDEYLMGPGVIATVDAPEPQGGFQAVNMQLTMAVP